MSYHWENIKWQSKDGSWSIGFFVRESAASSFGDDDDYDSEWDDTFDYSKFHFASVGHATPELAFASWRGANPGSSTSIPYSRENAKEIAEYEDMAKAYLDPAYAKERAERIAREHNAAVRRQLRDNLRQNPPLLGADYRVAVKSPGGNISVTGRMRREGDWFGFPISLPTKTGRAGKLRFVRMWNPTTRNVSANVLNITRTRSLWR